MLRLLVATSAAIYAGLFVFGDESRRVEMVSRSAVIDISVLPATSVPLIKASAGSQTPPVISDTKAVQIALDAGAKLREARKVKPLPSLSIIAHQKAAEATEEPLWLITGERVNIRQGPGTTNPVIGQATFGEKAHVLADRNGWYQIALNNGATTGWIFGKFLRETQPG